MYKYIKKEKTIKRVNVEDGKVLCTIEIGDNWVSNPTWEMVMADGWEEYTPPQPEPYVPTFDELYKQKIVELVRERYDVDDEFAILRQKDTKPEQFEEYNSFVEECKAKAHIYAEEMTQK